MTDLVVVDTNVLLAATDESRADHAAALRLLELDERRLALTPQIVREYLVVASRPREANGLGLSSAAAVANVRQLLEDMALLRDDAGSVGRLLQLVGDGPVVGTQVHDANVVAVALAHGADTVVTSNVRHFARFAHLVEVEPLEVGGGG